MEDQPLENQVVEDRRLPVKSERRGMTQGQLADILLPFAETVAKDESFKEVEMVEAFLIIVGWLYTIRCDVFAGAFRKLKVGLQHDPDAYYSKQRGHLRQMIKRGQESGILLRKNGSNMVAADWLGGSDDPAVNLGMIMDCMVLKGDLIRSCAGGYSLAK